MNHGDIVIPHAVIFTTMGFTVLTVEYRGYGIHTPSPKCNHLTRDRYGLCEGIPSESGLCLDAQAGFDYIANHPGLSKHPIVCLFLSCLYTFELISNGPSLCL
jgi:hypothetical protein